ncbi:MAG: PDZ domain-containing protein [Planctomycetota bacterium]
MNLLKHVWFAAMVMSFPIAWANGQETVGSSKGPWSRDQVSAAIAPVLANPPATGLLIYEVTPDSQSSKAGLRIGDVLTHYDGQPVEYLSDLVTLGRAAAAMQKNQILAIAKRGEEEIVAQFEPAPLGLRLTPVREGKPLTLWRTPTTYKPNLDALARYVKTGHRWERLIQEGQTIGWSHHYLTREGKTFALRTQSKIEANGLSEKRDTTVRFLADAYLTPIWIRVTSNGRLLLEIQRSGDEFRGERVGIQVVNPAMKDAVSSPLAGLVAVMMPAKAGNCLRCSFMDSTSLTAAPFADLYCAGEETVNIAGQTTRAFRYEQSVFGLPVVHFWIDQNRELLLTRYLGEGNVGGIDAVFVTDKEIRAEFQDVDSSFDPIEHVPAVRPLGQQAN